MITYNKETPILLLAYDGIENITSLFNEIQPLEVRRLYLACFIHAFGNLKIFM